MRDFLEKVYNTSGKVEDLDVVHRRRSHRDVQVTLRKGVPMATPVFDGAAESEIKAMLELADLPAVWSNYVI